MRKPYLITKHNPEDEILALEAKAKIYKPLEFLEHIRTTDDEWASDAPAFDINVRLEFVIIEEALIDKVNKALTDFGFNITITDATHELLHGKIDLANASEKTTKKIFDYYFNVFDANDILDKISYLKIGVESLTEIDKTILNKKP